MAQDTSRPPTWPSSVPAEAYPRSRGPAIAASGIAPANPPLPTCSYLPFQPEAGSHTSNLISESLVGFATPSTRQNAGRSNVGAGCPEPEGGVKAPAGTDVAAVIVALVSA